MRSFTVEETRTSEAPAIAATRAATFTRHARDVVADRLDLADVDTRADLESQLAERGRDLLRSADRLRRSLERREHAVARALHDAAPVPFDRAPGAFVVRDDQLPPGLIADPREMLGSTPRCR